MTDPPTAPARKAFLDRFVRQGDHRFPGSYAVITGTGLVLASGY